MRALTSYWLDNPEVSSLKGKKWFYSPKRPEILWAAVKQPSVHWAPEVQWPDREFVHYFRLV
jgi:hypothetical protein